MAVNSRSITALAFAVLAFGLMSCASVRESGRHVATADVSSEGVALINAFRAEHGLKPVTVDANLVRVAQRQVVAMATRDVLSHEVDGDFTSRINAAGYAHAAAAENVGAGHPTVENAIKSWIASPHHRDNMLMKEVTRIGLVRGEAPWSRYRSYWALDMASGEANSADTLKIAGISAVSGFSALFGQ